VEKLGAGRDSRPEGHQEPESMEASGGVPLLRHSPRAVSRDHRSDDPRKDDGDRVRLALHAARLPLEQDMGSWARARPLTPSQPSCATARGTRIRRSQTVGGRRGG
jgi:hypothetical protein